MKNNRASAFAPVVLLASCALWGCFNSNSNSGPPVTVNLTSTPSPATIQQGQTVNITASVSGPAGQSVTWTLTGPGSLSNQSVSSVTYNAPASVTGNVTATVTATAVANATASLIVTVTPPPPISVTISNGISVIAALPASDHAFVDFTAPVQNDPSGSGVSWTLTAAGAPCSPACGTITTDGLPVTFDASYTPPNTVPTGTADTPTITATSVADPTKSASDTFTIINGSTACGTGGNERALNGEYAMLLQGFTGSGTGTPVIISGSFAADGTGKITGGVEDVNRFTEFFVADFIPAGSGYSVGPDGRGCLTLTNQVNDTTLIFRFSLGSISGGTASKGDIIEFDDKTGTQQRMSGILRLQDPTAFSLSALQSNYAIGVDGWDEPASGTVPSHFAIAGSFSQSGGTISNGVFDANDGGTMTSETGGNGTIQAISTAQGRAMATLSLPGRPEDPVDIVIYVVNSSEILINNGGVSTLGSVFSGRAIATASSFSQSSILPSYIFRTTGSSSTGSSVSIGLASFSGGTASLTTDQYTGGAASTQNLSGNYQVDAISGRTAVGNGGTAQLILYPTNPVDGISAFSIGTDASASLGVFDVQPAGTYSNNSLPGNFFFGSSEPGDNTVSNFAGVLSVAAGTGTGTGTEDLSGPTGLTLASPVTLPLSITVNGSGNVGAKTVAVTNGTVLYFINENATPGVVGVMAIPSGDFGPPPPPDFPQRLRKSTEGRGEK